MKGLPVTQWFYATVKRIRKFSDRPIIVRAHPGDRKFKLAMLSKNFNYTISNKTNIIDDLKNAWACITFNSSPGVASAIEGIPVFVTDPNSKDSQAYKVSNFDLTQIENPIMPDRQTWIEEISMSHFNFNDLQKGIAWDIIRGYI
jgi:capsule polysaccharide modification protein KpsS